MTTDYRRRLLKAIPGGSHTYSRGPDQFPQNYPDIVQSGDGGYLFDSDGRRFLDYGMALRSCILGYNDQRVNAAAIEAISAGNNLTLPHHIELQAAERLIELVESVDMVKFAKNGSNVTTAAVKLARAFTGRRVALVPRQQPFFSFDDWFIGSTVMKRGTLDATNDFSDVFDYGDIQSLELLFEKHHGDVACVMLEPATTLLPCSSACATDDGKQPQCGTCPHRKDNFLVQVQALCKKHGALFILDEMITGFRWHIGGAQTLFGVTPDLSTFGKAMANGFSLAALGGRREVMELGGVMREGEERVFLLSSTHGAEMTSLNAFLCTSEIIEDENICAQLWNFNGKLRQVIADLTAQHGIKDHVTITGPDIALTINFLDSSGAVDPALRTLFLQEMARHNVLMPWIATCAAHDDDTLTQTGEALDKSFATLARGLADGIGPLIQGPPVKPVFRKYN